MEILFLRSGTSSFYIVVACCLSVCGSVCSLSVITISGSRAFPPRLAPCVERLGVTTSGTVGLRPHRVVVAAYYALPPEAIPKPKDRERMSLATFYYDVETGGVRSTR